MGVKTDIARYEIIDVAEETNVKFYTSIDKGSYIPNHWHRAIEIIYVLEGVLDITIEARTITLTEGDCILVNANSIHSTKCIVPNIAILIQIPLEFLETYMPNVQQFLFVWDCHTKNVKEKTKIEMLKNTLMQMQIVNDIRPEGFLLRFNSLLFELLFQLYHNFRVKVFQSNFNQRTKDLERLNTVLEYISKHYKEPISLEEIAKITFLQPRYFCRFFKKCMGVTFLQYQNELRLSYIYRDLISTTDAIHTILERHGFTNYKLFRRMFQEHFFGTPSQVRKSMQMQVELK